MPNPIHSYSGGAAGGAGAPYPVAYVDLSATPTAPTATIRADEPEHEAVLAKTIAKGYLAYYCQTTGENVILDLSPPTEHSNAAMQMAQKSLGGSTHPISPDQATTVLNRIAQLRDLYFELGSKKVLPPTVEVKASGGKTPCSILLDTENGHIIARSKNPAFQIQNIRRALIQTPDEAFTLGYEYRSEMMLKSEITAKKYKDCPYIADPSKLFYCKNKEDDRKKYSSVDWGRDISRPNLYQVINHKNSDPINSGNLILRGFLVFAKALEEVHKREDVYSNFKFNCIHLVNNREFKLGELYNISPSNEDPSIPVQAQEEQPIIKFGKELKSLLLKSSNSILEEYFDADIIPQLRKIGERAISKDFDETPSATELVKLLEAIQPKA